MTEAMTLKQAARSMHLWPADQAQIYRTLDKLRSKVGITCTVKIQLDRPNSAL